MYSKKTFLSIMAAALALSQAKADNYPINTPYQAGKGSQVTVKSIEAAGVHTPVVALDSGSSPDISSIATNTAKTQTLVTGTITTQNLTPSDGATAGSAVEYDVNGFGTVVVQVTGTYTGALSCQLTQDGSNWVTRTSGTAIYNLPAGTYSGTIASGSNGIYEVDVTGCVKMRFTALGAVTGTATLTMQAGDQCKQVRIGRPVLAASSNIIGQVGIDQTVDGTTNKVSADIAKVAGATIATGHGTAAGSVRVELPTDGTGVVGLNAGSNIIGQVRIDQTTDGTTNKVQANQQVGNTAVSSTNPMPVYGLGVQVSVSTTRPNDTTAYSSLDVVGESPVAANLNFSNVARRSGAGVVITGASLRVDSSSVPSGMGSFRLHLYNAAPTAILDNAAFNIISADRTKYLGYIEIPTPVDQGDTLWGQADNANLKRDLAIGSTTLYGVLQTVGAFTPSAQTVKTVTIYVMEL